MVCTTSLSVNDLPVKIFFFWETLTHVINGQICTERRPSLTNQREVTAERTQPARFDANRLQECLLWTVKMLSGLIKMHDSMLGMLSHH